RIDLLGVDRAQGEELRQEPGVLVDGATSNGFQAKRLSQLFLVEESAHEIRVANIDGQEHGARTVARPRAGGRGTFSRKTQGFFRIECSTSPTVRRCHGPSARPSQTREA